MSQPKSSVPRARWSLAEDQAVRHAYHHTETASDFLGSVRASVPDAPERTIKAYLTYLYERVVEKDVPRRAVYEDLCRANQTVTRDHARELALKRRTKDVKDVKDVGVQIPDYLNDVADGPLPVAPKAPVANFSAPPSVGVKPDPKATVPRHYRVPVYTQTSFSHRDITDIFKIDRAREAVETGAIPSHEGDIRREVFMALHEAMSDGLDFDAACGVVREKFTEKPIVPAEALYTKVEPDPNKVREGYIPNPFLKGPFPIGKNREAPTLDDPNSDAMDAFTVEEAAAALGLTDTGILLTAINRDGFPAVKIDGKWRITRADLKRVRALRESGLTTEEALKRAGAPVPPITVPSETSWTDHVAPLTTEEKGEADGTPDVVDRDPVWEMVSLEELASELHIHVASVYQGVSDHPLVRKHGDDLGVPRQAFDLIEKKWRKCRSLKEAFDFAAEKLGVLPPPPPTTEDGEAGDARLPVPDDKAWKRDPALYPMKAYTKAPADEQRQWALEALNEGVFTVEQALKIAGVTDTPRNRWALGLLGRGEITLAQAAKLLR